MKTTITLTRPAKAEVDLLPDYIRRDRFLQHFDLLPIDTRTTIVVRHPFTMRPSTLVYSDKVEELCRDYTQLMEEFLP